ncbi:MAG TPA: VOC family protein [bacterium]|nr:VOC family protein [bacterium]
MNIKGRTQTNPYLTFNGNCEEAMKFYKEATGGELYMMPFEGSPVRVPKGYESKVLHSTLTFGDAVIMASDTVPGRESEAGTNCHVMLGCDALEDAEVLFHNLSHNGTVTIPFSVSYSGARFGMFTDKYGIHWMVHCDCEASGCG